MSKAITTDIIESKILLIRGHKVMLDRDLAKLYGVETKVLNQAVKRNLKRFPLNFMFQLNPDEFKNWKSQNVTSKAEKMSLRKRPYAFTEHGILMLSSVLNTDKAIDVNIQIMQTFIKIRTMLISHKELKEKIEELEQKYDYQFKIVFDTIKKLIDHPVKRKP